MRTATLLLNASLLVAGIGLLTAPVALLASPAAAAQDAATEDVVYLKDGRVFHGKIVSEDRREIVFEFVDRSSNIKTRLTFRQDQIHKLERDVPVEVDPAPTTTRTTGTRRSDPLATSRADDDSFLSRYTKRSRSMSDDPSVPSVYLIPMEGQMGTDVHIDVYKDLVDDIRYQDPDLIVWVLKCSDVGSDREPNMDPSEQGLKDLDQYRHLVDLLQDDLRGYEQIMWVHDSVGISSVIALAWEQMYMHPKARLMGLSDLYSGASGWQDEDVRAKMIAAWLGIANAFLERGDRQVELGTAMMDPNKMLSASWKGREVEWSLDKDGEYLVDGTDKGTANFTAKTASDLCISLGTAEELDDLMLIRGAREYRLIEGEAPATIEKYVEDWRRALDRAKEKMQDYQQHRGWATGEDTVKYLGKAKKDLEQVVSLMERYKPVETRMAIAFGVRKFDLETMIEQIQEQLRSMRTRGGGVGTGRGSGGGRRGNRGPGESPR